MWIHMILFIIFCALFICARGFFSKSGIYLAEKLPQYYKLMSVQIRRFLMIAFYGNLLGLAVTVAMGDRDNLHQLERQDVTYSEEMYVTDGSNKEKLTVEIGKEPYTEEEKQKLLDETLVSLPEMILGENESLNKIEYPLNLMSEISESGITIQWNTDQPLILDWEGQIGEDVPAEGAKVLLQANLLLEDYQRMFETELIIYPQKKTEAEIFREDIEKQLLDQNSKQGKYLELPKETGGKVLIWSKANRYQGIWVTGFAILIGALLILAENNRRKEFLAKKRAEMQEDYPGILNKLILLMQAGMSSRRSIQKMALDYRKNVSTGKTKRYAYEEILQMHRELEQGIPEEEVYRSFGNRCELICYRSLSTLLIQHLKKGSSYFLDSLKKECTLAFEERKNRALIRGEQAGTKLLIPMACMLLIVLLIILVPSMMTLG